MDNKPEQQKLKIEISPEVAAGHYANLAVVSPNASEFFIDFIAVTPNMPQAKVQSRIIMTPENAKVLLSVLGDHIRRYEATFGTIEHKVPKSTPTKGGIPNPFEA